MTLAAIADATGFADQYHFSRRFRRRFGMAPGSYRRVAPIAEPPLPRAIVAVLRLIDRLSLPGHAMASAPAGIDGSGR
jgi:AraC-like DNA-binding protein